MSNIFRPTAKKRVLFFLLFDALLSLLSLYVAYLLRFNFDVPDKFFESFWLVYTIIVTLKLGLLFWYKIYFIVWRFFGFSDAKRIFYAHIIAYGVFTVIYISFSSYFAPFPRSVVIIDMILSLLLIGLLRASKRFFTDNIVNSSTPVLLIGVNTKTATMIQSAMVGDIDYYPVAIMQTKQSETTKNTYIHNVKIYQLSDIDKVVKGKSISSAIVTEQLTPTKLKKIIAVLNNHGISNIKKVTLIGNSKDKLEDISIEDLLARHPKDLDIEAIDKFIRGKSILITGAGGSIGSEIAKQCHNFNAAKLTLVDSSEYNLYQIGEQIPNAILKLISVINLPMLQKIVNESKADIVIHAAAYKHVPICQSNQLAAIENNIIGTKNLIDASINAKVKKVVIISTDKAVRPTNVMGATKRVTELYANNVDTTNTEIVAVRFGNVLGSSGSVIPKFKEQIENGGPVTVTHEKITRYFMLIPEACQLVLQTATIAKGGELFVLDMGEPVRIIDLAHQMIRLYGKGDEVEVKITGLRPGEKLYEELLLDESESQTKFESIFIAKPTKYNIEQLNKDIENLLSAKNKIEALQKIVPEFVPFKET
jgi:UDP-N-acetyl-D-glucosamine 4,6-dehydratase